MDDLQRRGGKRKPGDDAANTCIGDADVGARRRDGTTRASQRVSGIAAEAPDTHGELVELVRRICVPTRCMPGTVAKHLKNLVAGRDKSAMKKMREADPATVTTAEDLRVPLTTATTVTSICAEAAETHGPLSCLHMFFGLDIDGVQAGNFSRISALFGRESVRCLAGVCPAMEESLIAAGEGTRLVRDGQLDWNLVYTIIHQGARFPGLADILQPAVKHSVCTYLKCFGASVDGAVAGGGSGHDSLSYTRAGRLGLWEDSDDEMLALWVDSMRWEYIVLRLALLVCPDDAARRVAVVILVSWTALAKDRAATPQLEVEIPLARFQDQEPLPAAILEAFLAPQVRQFVLEQAAVVAGHHPGYEHVVDAVRAAMAGEGELLTLETVSAGVRRAIDGNFSWRSLGFALGLKVDGAVVRVMNPTRNDEVGTMGLTHLADRDGDAPPPADGAAVPANAPTFAKKASGCAGLLRSARFAFANYAHMLNGGEPMPAADLERIVERAAAVKATSELKDAEAKAAAAAFVGSGQYAAGHGTKLLTGLANANAAVKTTSASKDPKLKAAAEELVRSGQYAAGHGTFVATGKSNANRAAVLQAAALTRAAQKNPQILQRCKHPACRFQVPCSDTHRHFAACVKLNDERGRVARFPNAGEKCSECWKAANLTRK